MEKKDQEKFLFGACDREDCKALTQRCKELEADLEARITCIATDHVVEERNALKPRIAALEAIVRDAEIAFMKLLHLNASVVQPIVGKVVVAIVELDKGK